MVNRRFGARWAMGFSVGFVVAVLFVGGLATVSARPSTMETAPAASLEVSITVSPSPATAGNPVTFTAQVSGGVGPYTFVWYNTPPGCNGAPEASWQCTISSPGNYMINVTVTDSAGDHGNASQTFTVTSNEGNGNGGSGNGNGNGNGSHSNGNGSNGLNLSSFGPILVYGLIAGVIVFGLLVALTVGVIMIAVTLRRLPKIPKGAVVCATCQATAPPGAKFCPACAAPLGPPKK